MEISRTIAWECPWSWKFPCNMEIRRMTELLHVKSNGVWTEISKVNVNHWWLKLNWQKIYIRNECLQAKTMAFLAEIAGCADRYNIHIFVDVCINRLNASEWRKSRTNELKNSLHQSPSSWTRGKGRSRNHVVGSRCFTTRYSSTMDNHNSNGRTCHSSTIRFAPC